MQQEIKCGKCNHVADLNSRYCKKCGNSLWVSLDSETIKGKSLTDILNSIYNLLTDKTNPDRWKFIDKRSDEAIWGKVKLTYANYNPPFWMPVSEYGNFNDNKEALYQSSACDSLSGYSVRVSEELFSGKKTVKMSLTEAEYLIDKFMSEEKKGGILYQVNIQDQNIKRIVFSEALSIYHKYSDFILMDKKEIFPFIKLIQRQNVQIGANKKEDEVIGDFNFGYFLRVSESLMPYSKGGTGLFEKTRMSREEYEKLIIQIKKKLDKENEP
jgi:hypothetical protein